MKMFERLEDHNILLTLDLVELEDEKQRTDFYSSLESLEWVKLNDLSTSWAKEVRSTNYDRAHKTAISDLTKSIKISKVKNIEYAFMISTNQIHIGNN